MKFEPDKHLHSKEHVLADDISRMMREPKRFAAYLGIAKLYYEHDLRALARRVLEKEDLPPEARGKYFFAVLRGLEKKKEVILKEKGAKNGMEKILPIIKEPNKILRKKATDVFVQEITSLPIQRFIDSMKETLKNTPDGVGLAAPQVGKSLQIFIVSDEAEEIDKAERKQKEKNITSHVKLEDKESEKEEKPYEIRNWHYHVFINPAIKKISKRTLTGPEGCLSVPGKFGTVARKEKITVEAYDERGKKFTRGASKFFARVIQHELDHLEGILFVDKTVGKVQHINVKRQR